MNEVSVLRTVSSCRVSGNSFHLGRRRVIGSLVLALVATLAFVTATSSRAVADTSLTVVRLSCNDGHSVIISVDLTTLTNLAADIQAINSGITGLSCTLDTLDPSTENTEWTVYDYNPSGHAIAPRNSPNSLPATTTGSTTTFQFKVGIYTALLTTTDRALTGDLSTETLSDTVSWFGTGTFSYRDSSFCGSPPAKVRFYFRSPAASGPSTGTPPAGFYTQFWWSNPDDVDLVSDPGSGTLSATLTWPAAAGMWSDWNGKENTESPAVTAAFIQATQNVQAIGLSFGGGCFFENGVTTASGGTFSSTFTETP